MIITLAAMSEFTTKALSAIYHKNIDKQRIVLIGGHSETIFKMVKHVLGQYGKKADYLTTNEINTAEPIEFTSAPLLLFNHPQPDNDVIQLNPHFIILSNPLDKSESQLVNSIIDSLPKSGILIADDREPVAAIAKKERADVVTVNFKEYPHTSTNEGVSLITSTNEKFMIKISGVENLRCISAAKETVKRIGVSSGQFYRAITTFTL